MNYLDLLNCCTLCNRKCSVDRTIGEIGYCKATNELKVSRAALHHWEEPCISGTNGSGTVFFSHCNLSCVYCQNHNISQEGLGKIISIDRLASIFIELQASGAHNINLVTPTHYVPQIIIALNLAKKQGLQIPIIYNTNGFDSVETIKQLDGLVDVYVPDFKYYSPKHSEKYSNSVSYSTSVLNTIKEMVSQVGPVVFKNGLIAKGVIVRHLALPGLLFDSKKIIDTLYTTFGNNIYISLMSQYVPMYNAKLYPEINKQLNPKVYDSLVDYTLRIGVVNGFIQGEGANTTDFIPQFNNEGV